MGLTNRDLEKKMDISNILGSVQIDQKKVKKSDRNRQDYFFGIVKGFLKTSETPPGPLKMSVFGPEFFVLPPERQISLPKMGSPSIQNVRGPPYGFGQKSTIIEDSEVFWKLGDPILDTRKLSSCLCHSGL